MKHKTKIIVFEGMPGAGKTMIIKMLKVILGKQAIVMPQIALPSSHSNNSLMTSKKYLDMEINKADKIRKLSGKYKYFLVDRVFLTTLAYAYARSRQSSNLGSYRELLKYFLDLDAKRHFLRPTLFFLFFVSIEKSIDRRAKYAKNKAFKWWFDSIFLKQMEIFYNKHSSNFGMPNPIIIDTTLLKPKEIISIVRQYIL